MSPPASSSDTLWVVCLCAEWCGTCRDYRTVFEQIAHELPQARFVWVDIEDEADWVDPVEVDNFPTLLLADAQGARFFGTVLPHKDTLVRLVQSQLGPTPPSRAGISDEAHALARRLVERGG